MRTEEALNALGAVIKSARNRKGLTQGQLAEKIGKGERHIMGIENEGKSLAIKPLFAIVHELNIPGDDIFYPDRKVDGTELDYLIRLLKQCSDRDIVAITALAEAMLHNPIENK